MIRILCKIFGVVFLIFLVLSFIALIVELSDDGTKDLGAGYEIFYYEPQSIWGPKIKIPPEIIDYQYDRHFIIVKQRLNGKEPEFEFHYHYNYPSLYGDYYWIIDKQEDTFYGPLGKEDFIHKSDSLHVKLSLDSI